MFGIPKRIPKSLMVRGMAKRIPKYKPGSRDGQAHPEVHAWFDSSRDAQAYPLLQTWFAGWPNVSLITGMVRGMAKRIPNCRPGSRDAEGKRL